MLSIDSVSYLSSFLPFHPLLLPSVPFFFYYLLSSSLRFYSVSFRSVSFSSKWYILSPALSCTRSHTTFSTFHHLDNAVAAVVVVQDIVYPGSLEQGTDLVPDLVPDPEPHPDLDPDLGILVLDSVVVYTVAVVIVAVDSVLVATVVVVIAVVVVVDIDLIQHLLPFYSTHLPSQLSGHCH